MPACMSMGGMARLHPRRPREGRIWRVRLLVGWLDWWVDRRRGANGECAHWGREEEGIGQTEKDKDRIRAVRKKERERRREREKETEREKTSEGCRFEVGGSG